MENTEKIFLKEQEMNEYKVLQEKINQVIYSMGEVSVEKQILKEKEEMVMANFNKVRKEFRNEKLLLMFILNFVYIDKDRKLENISFM